MDGFRPVTPNFDGNSPWRWAWAKFGMEPEDLVKTLAEQYNITVPCQIQGLEAFHHDVSAIGAEANDTGEFHQMLARRRDQRLEEIREAWNEISVDAFCQSTILDDNPNYVKAFLHFTSNFSFDSLVILLRLFLQPLQTPPPQLLDTAHVNAAEAVHPQLGQVSPELPLPDTALVDPTATPCKLGAQVNLAVATAIDIHSPTQADINKEDRECSRRDEDPQAGRSRLPPKTTRRRVITRSLTREAGVQRKRPGCPSTHMTDPEKPRSDTRRSLRLRQQQQPATQQRPHKTLRLASSLSELGR